MGNFEIDERIQQIAARCAAEFAVDGCLHSEDELLQYVLRSKGIEQGVEEYFRGGRNNAFQVKRVIDQLPLPLMPSVLEFAAGFGRVTRHIPRVFSPCRFVTSDIHPQGCDFIRSKFKIPTLLSAHRPEDLDIDERFDFIFVLSLFSHLPDSSFGRWLSALYDRLKPGGFLHLTANGQVTIRKRPAFWGENFDSASGFGFARQSDQLDLDPEEYGSMAISLRYMSDQLQRFLPDALLYSMNAGVWFGQQDEWIVRKPA